MLKEREAARGQKIPLLGGVAPQGRGGPRQSNFELLRILLMLMIVSVHMVGYGGLLGHAETPLSGRVLLVLLSSGGKVGVNGFVMLSGYFLCTSKSLFQSKRLLKLWLQIFFYSAGLFFGLYFAGLCRMHPDDAFHFLLPVTQNIYWFASVFFLLMLAAPFLNRLLQSLDRKSYRALLLVVFLAFSLMPTFLRVRYEVPRLCWFFYLYLLAGYIRLHPEPIFDKKWPTLAVAVGSYLVSAFYAPLHSNLLPYIPLLRHMPERWHTPGTSVPALLCSLALFIFFKNVNIKGSRVINLIASGTFGVYLLHEHGIRMRRLIWLELFDGRPITGSTAALLGHALLAIFAVFAVGVVIDLIRQYALERPLFLALDKTKLGKKYLQ
ncbi:MAG: acyltransferase [Oscillospiraceae bacterium]|nr:acyltransferase [Oscillospiraceae bacterium]